MDVVHRAAGAVACLALAACGEGSGARPKASSDPSVSETMPAAVVRAALNFVVEKVRNVHPDTAHGLSDESERALVDTRAIANEPMSADRLSFVLNEWLASLHDAHVAARYKESAGANAGCVDLPLSWRPQGLIVTRDTGTLGRGERIVSIGEHGEASLFDELRKIVPVENDYRLKYLGAKYLQRADFLRHLGVTAGDRVTVVAETRSGGRRELGLPVDGCDRADPNPPWVGFEFHERHALGVFWFERFEYNQEMVDAMESFFVQVDERGIDKVAVDLRGKTGGDSTVAFAFLEHFADISYRSFSVEVRISDELGEMSPAFDPVMVSPLLVEAGLPAIGDGATSYVLPGPFVRAVIAGRMNLKPPDEMRRVRGKQIYMLTDGGTFSSGNLFAILLRDNRIGTLIGEPTGNRVNFNGSELRFDVPGTGLYLNLSTAKMLRPDAGLGDAPAIEPDVLIVTSRDDIAAGRDPQLEYLKAL